ncbi:MAG: hypothetical protein JOZ69_06665, partial [Myxococcales bacterium]|nr:hypothetical protein [Myxococcales bacterium]
ALQLGRWKALGAYGIAGGQVAFGGGLRVVTMQIVEDGAPTLLTMTGVGPEVGALWMPTGSQWRVGAAVRAPVSGGIFGSERVTVEDNVRRAGSFILPSRIVMPWEVEAGVAYQLGPRPLNPGWQNPHDQERRLRSRLEAARAERALDRERRVAEAPPEKRETLRAQLDAQEEFVRGIEDQRYAADLAALGVGRKARYQNWPREKILLLASVLVSGPSETAISLEGFLDQRAEAVGGHVTLTPRLGLEGEPLRDRILLRTGTYLEPSRYESGVPRQHFTFGGDVRLFPLDFWRLLPDTDWKLAFFVDLAPRYANGGLALGTWH